MKKQFEGKTILITGGGKGIGRETAILMAEEGGNIIILDMNLDFAEQTRDMILAKGGQSAAFCADVCNEAEVSEALEKAKGVFGQIDVLVNNAGGLAGWYGLEGGRFIDSNVEVWRTVIERNLIGAMIVAHAVVGDMVKKRSGKIIFLGSVAGINGINGYADYSAAKGGVIALTKVLAKELAEYQINVNCVSPGSIDTHGGGPQTLLNRLGTPREAAELIAFLSSDKADFITGQNMVIDGGRTLSLNC